jgi:hypothetical protein
MGYSSSVVFVRRVVAKGWDYAEVSFYPNEITWESLSEVFINLLVINPVG